MEHGYRDYHLNESAAVLGFPTVAPLDANEIVIADWRGSLQLFNVSAQSGTYFALPEDPLLSSPQPVYGIALSPSAQFAIIVCRSPRFFLWHVGTADFREVYAESGGQVHCAAVSPNGQTMALGLGDYPLDPKRTPEAKVELWDLDDDSEPRFVQATALPGVCVDQICWHPDGTAVYCSTGMRNQKQGFVVQMDPWGHPMHFRDLDAAVCGSVVGRRPAHVLVRSSGRVLSMDMETGSIEWEKEFAGKTPMGYDPESDQILLGAGELLDASTGKQLASLRPLEDASSIAALPESGWVAVSRTGIIRYWPTCDSAPNAP